MFCKEMEFQDSEIGKLPKSWEVQKLNGVVKEAKSGFASGKRDEKGILQLRMNSIQTDGKINIEGGVRVPIPPNVSDYILRKGDVLFDNTNSVDLIGKTAIFKGEFSNAVYSNHLTRLRVDNDLVIPEWITYVMIRKWKLGIFKAMCHRHVHQAGINSSDLLNIKIPVPPLGEQQEVSKVLGVVDSALAWADRVVAKTERLKKGLMQQLLTQGIDRTEYKETPIGKIPASWQVSRIGDYVDLLTGFPFESNLFSDNELDIKLVRGINVTTGKLRWERTKYWKSAKDLEKYLLQANDILIGMDGALVGKNYAIVTEQDLPILLVQRVARLRVKGGIHPEFLYYLIGSPSFRNYVDKVNTSSGIAHISGKQIEDFPIPMPPYLEQLEIVAILSAVSRKLDLEIGEKTKLERIKSALMDLFLTGKVRIQVD